MSKYYGFKIKFPEYHLDENKLHSLRHECDEKCDHVAESISEYSLQNDILFSEALDLFLRRGVVINDVGCKDFLDEIYKVPYWVDWDLLRRGQRVYLAHAASASLGMLYLSLIGGFSAPKIIKVLDCTAYLGANEYATYKRLLETLEMIIDCVEKDAMIPGNNGWLSVLKVRFLHSHIRRRILKSAQFDVKNWGIPINEEDMIVTQLSFSYNILHCIDVIGSRISDLDRHAYLHLWRYIGYLIGIKEVNNPCYSLPVAGGCLESMAVHLITPDERSIELAQQVLRSVTTYSPTKWTYTRHCQAARYFLGNALADALHLDYSFCDYLFVAFSFFFITIFNYTVSPYILVKDDHFLLTKIVGAYRIVINKHIKLSEIITAVKGDTNQHQERPQQEVIIDETLTPGCQFSTYKNIS